MVEFVMSKLNRKWMACFNYSVLGAGAFAIAATALPVMAQSVESPLNKRPSKVDMSKVSGSLLNLHEKYQGYQEQKSVQKLSTVFNPPNSRMVITADTVVFDAAASGDPEVLANDLKALGALDVTVFGRMVSGRLPLSAIPALKNLPSLQLVRPSYMTKHPVSAGVTSQGDFSMQSEMARTTFEVDGTGVKVGTLSDSYNCLGGAAEGVANGELPVDVTVLQEGPCPGSDEGRAMMEIIHDVAPGAALSFRSAFIGGQAGFAQGILDLAADGATVINDDISYNAEPFYQDGVISQAIDMVAAQGVSYFTSTGNAGRKAYEAPFRPSGQTVNLGSGNGDQEAHDFDPGPGVDICQQITIPAGASVTISFQWDEPFFSVSGAPGSASDLDILLTDASCNTSAPLAIADNPNFGADPVEILSFDNPGSEATFNLVILKYSGPNPGLMKTIATSENFTYDEFDTKTGASYGHPLAVGASGVGAAFYQQTPAFGQTPPLIEESSSAGGTAILFDTAGNRLATPNVRQNPMITGPDGGNTSFFGSDFEGDGFPNFFGTSAAAPHVAGVAALMNELVPGITPAAINTALQNTAIDMNDPSTPGFDIGFDYGTGYGLVDANAALAAIAPPTVVDVTSNVKISQTGIRYDRRTGQFVQQVTVANITAGFISDPVSLVLDNLSSNVTLANLDGTNSGGAPYVTLNTGGDGLAPGESTSILLQFSNPTFQSITYKPAVFSGTL